MPHQQQQPSKVTFTKYESGDQLVVQWNPSELKEGVTASWGRLKTMGMSHTQPQFGNTENHSVSFDLAFSAYDDRGNQINNMARARRFLLSCCYPKRGAQTIAGGAPERIIFVWPKLISFTTLIESVEFTHQSFALDGQPTRTTAALKIEEIRDVRLYAEDVFSSGTLR